MMDAKDHHLEDAPKLGMWLKRRMSKPLANRAPRPTVNPTVYSPHTPRQAVGLALRVCQHARFSSQKMICSLEQSPKATQLEKLGNEMKSNEYGQYLLRLLTDDLNEPWV